MTDSIGPFLSKLRRGEYDKLPRKRAWHDASENTVELTGLTMHRQFIQPPGTEAIDCKSNKRRPISCVHPSRHESTTLEIPADFTNTD